MYMYNPTAKLPHNKFILSYLMNTDEVIVPANHFSWFSMVTSVKNYKQLAGIIVPSAFFDPHWRQKGTVAAEWEYVNSQMSY